jgi:peptidoglycan/LPS O-acetylase OafA/YrhL
MNRIRRLLWKYLGMTLDRETLVVIGVVVLCCVATIVFGILSAHTNSFVFRLLAFIAAVPLVLITLGGSSRAMFWSVSDKRERAEIEKDVALEQLRRRVRDKHYER